MSQACVCSANPEYRSGCEAACSACDFLISERRVQRQGKVIWYEPERRALTNLLPMPAPGNVGLATAVDAAGRKAWPDAWYWLVLLVVFNVADSLFTAKALSLGYAEGNPVMASLLDFNPPLAMFIKTAVVGLGAYFLWRNQQLSIAAWGLAGLTVLYGVLVAFHLFFLLPV